MGIKSKEDKAMQVISHVMLAFCAMLAIIPFWLLIAASFTDADYAVRYGYKFFPQKFSMEAYDYIMREGALIGHAYGMTILITVMGTVLSILFTAMLAYGLIQKNVKGVKIIFILILLTMLFNGGIVPTYYVYINVLHVKDTLWGLILPNLLMNGFTVILVKNYMYQNIPGELLEAAKIDGAGQFAIFFKMVFPLSKAILATVGLLSAVSYWNDWTNGLYYISESKLYTIQLLLNQMNSNIMFMANNSQSMAGVDVSSLPSATIRMAIAVVAVLPIIIAYPFFQKYFAKGITMGSVKG